MDETQETPQETPTEALEAERAAHQATREALTAAATRYREALLTLNPQVPPDLLQGDNIETLDRSLESARSVVAAVLERATPTPTTASADASDLDPGPSYLPPVPAGAPIRSAPDTSAMSAAEKIRYALTHSA